jgi:tetratricopeptide (TPR) repeat protein
VKSPRTYLLLLIALLVACFGAATRLQPQFQFMRISDNQKSWIVDLNPDPHVRHLSRVNGDIFNVVLGDSRRMFANSFYLKADKYYHSGYYPTMFDDKAAFQTTHMAADTGAVSDKNSGDEHGFLGPTRNWIDAFGRHFFPDRHTHLDAGGADDNLGGSDEVREILPWLKLSADLDPENVQTYTVTAYWLRERMNNPEEAEAVLHEGLRNCPDSYDILFELGRLYYESYRDRNRARNVWEFGVSQWRKIYPQLDPETQKDNRFIMEQLTTHLAKLEEDSGNIPAAIYWFEQALPVTITPDAIQNQIDRLKWNLYQEFNPELKPLYDSNQTSDDSGWKPLR